MANNKFGASTDGRTVTIKSNKFTYNATKGVWEKAGSTGAGVEAVSDITVTGNLTVGGYTVLTSNNLTDLNDADTLGTLTSDQFVRSDATDTITGELTINNNVNWNPNGYAFNIDSDLRRGTIQWLRNGSSRVNIIHETDQDHLNFEFSNTGTGQLQINGNAIATENYVDSAVANVDVSGSTILTAIKTVDGTGSGLDADTVDGVHASTFVRADSDVALQADLTVAGYIKVGDTADAASAAGAGALKYTSRLLLSNGTQWLPVYIERDGSAAKPIYYPDDVADIYSSGNQTLYVNPAGKGDTVQYSVNFDTPSAPKYRATNTGTGFCVNTAGSVGSCSQGTGAAYDLWSAASYCMKAGARLCSKANLGAATGSGCSHDSRGIWTTDTDANGNHWVGQGNAPNTGGWYSPDHTGAISGFSTNDIGIRCCGTGSADSQYWEV
jgi:hypothetical protein